MGEQVDRKQAYVEMLRFCLGQLGVEDAEAGQARWVVERGETVEMLREVCGDFGDNDWPDDLHLRDVIEKHLARHLMFARNLKGG